MTINNWISVFEDFPETKQVILDCFQFVVNQSWIKIHGFVIMRDHLHLICSNNREDSIISTIKSIKIYTGKNICKILKERDPEYLDQYFMSSRSDRTYKFWKNKGGMLRVSDVKILLKKLDYIHENPTKGDYQIVEKPEDYFFSSSSSYKNKIAEFSFLSLLSL